jgi:membrane protease YdiL (CAAX protease family)
MNRMLPSVLTDFADFLRRPRVMVPSGMGTPEAQREWATMLALHLVGVLLVVLPLIKGWQALFGLPSPDAFGKIPPMLLVPVVVLAAPLAEEIVFRGWQTGRPRALWLALSAALGIAAIVTAEQAGSDLGVVITLFAALLIVAGGWFALRKARAVPRWFEAAFPAIFYLVAAGFALAHLSNYPKLSLLAVPMVLPQLWAGLTLGFMRLRFGLPASILAHACANGAAVALALLLR